MVSKKTKIGKMFHTDKEYADYLIERAKRKKERKPLTLSKRIGHTFFIHTWKKIETERSHCVSKCKFCGEFQCIEEFSDKGIFYSVGSLVAGAVLLFLGIFGYPDFLSPGLIVAGIICTWNVIKRSCEYYWKES